MAGPKLDHVKKGMEVYEPDGTPFGTVVGVHPNPPEGTMAPGVGYVEIETERGGATRHIHLPLTEVLEVRGDRVVAEIDPDFVTNPDQQWVRVKPPR